MKSRVYCSNCDEPITVDHDCKTYYHEECMQEIDVDEDLVPVDEREEKFFKDLESDAIFTEVAQGNYTREEMRIMLNEILYSVHISGDKDAILKDFRRNMIEQFI